MLKSMSIHQKDSKGTVKTNFVIWYPTFRGSIPTEPNLREFFYFFGIERNRRTQREKPKK